MKKYENYDQKNIYSNKQSDFDDINQIFNNESQELTIIESPIKKNNLNNQNEYLQIHKNSIQNKKNN